MVKLIFSLFDVQTGTFAVCNGHIMVVLLCFPFLFTDSTNYSVDMQCTYITLIFTFQIDYSNEAETLSANSINTAITLTNLMSGIDYSINVTAITDVGEITTDSISIVTSKNAGT